MKSNTKSKMKFEMNGMTFEIPSTCLRVMDYWGNLLATPVINFGRKEVPLIAKQYIKAKYPEMLVWAKSSVFANGNSVDVYVCNENGSELDLDSKEWTDIYNFITDMKGGSYNGMEDIYEYGPSGTTDNGTVIDFGAKYISINNKAPFGSWPDCKRMITDMMEGKYVWGVVSFETAIEKVRGYNVKETDLQKAVTSMGIN